MPAIFNGIQLNPLDPGSTSYLLWIMMGYLLVTAVLVVAFGRLGDMWGRVRMYNAGFAIFTIGSLVLAATPFTGAAGAIWIIAMRFVQAIGGALLFANSQAILTDAFPAEQRGLAFGINGISFLAGQFVGLVVGGILAAINWRLVFFVSVPVGIVGTICGYLRLEALGTVTHARIDWLGNVISAVGLPSGHLAAAARVRLRRHAPVGGHLHAAAHRWLARVRAAGRVSLRPVRCAAIRHRRHARGHRLVPRPHPAAGELPILGIRRPAAGERHRRRLVLLAEHGRHHEQRARPPARRGGGYADHVPEHRHGGLDRRVLQPDDRGPGGLAPGHPLPGTHCPRRAGRGRGAGF